MWTLAEFVDVVHSFLDKKPHEEALAPKTERCIIIYCGDVLKDRPLPSLRRDLHEECMAAPIWIETLSLDWTRQRANGTTSGATS